MLRLQDLPGLGGLGTLQEEYGLRLAAIGDVPRRALLADVFPRSFPDRDLCSLLPFANLVTLVVETERDEAEIRDAIYRLVPLASLVEWRLYLVEDLDAWLAARVRNAWTTVDALSVGSDGLADPLDARGEYATRRFSFRPPPRQTEPADDVLLRVLDFIRMLFEIQPLLRLSIADVNVLVEGDAKAALGSFLAARSVETVSAAFAADAIRRFNVTVAAATSNDLLDGVIRWTGIGDVIDRFPVRVRTRFLQILAARRQGNVLIDSSWRGENQFRLPLSRDSWETGASVHASLAELVVGQLEHDTGLIALAPVTIHEGEEETSSAFDGEFIHLAIPLDAKTSAALQGYGESDLAAVLVFGAYDDGGVQAVPELIFPVPSVFTLRADEQGSLMVRINALKLPSFIGPILAEAGIGGVPVVSVLVLGASGEGRAGLRDARELELVPAPQGEDIFADAYA